MFDERRRIVVAAADVVVVVVDVVVVAVGVFVVGLVVALTFFVGAYFGSKLSLKLNPNVVKLLFGILMALVSVKLILSGYQSIVSNDE